MATQNAIDIQFPLDVTDGGTGSISLDNMTILVGNGILPLNVVPDSISSTTHLPLVGFVGSDPHFTSMSISATGFANDLTFTRDTAGTDVFISCNDPTATSTIVGIRSLTVAGGGDPYVYMTVNGGDAYTIGQDVSDGSSIKITNGIGPSAGSTFMKIEGARRLLPLQPTFIVTGSTDETNVTGDGTTYQLQGFDTEIVDKNNNFSSNTFTAPKTGIYNLSVTVSIIGLTASHDTGFLRIVTLNRTYQSNEFNFGAIKTTTGDRASFTLEVLADMDSLDTAIVEINVDNGTKVVDIEYTGSPLSTYFSGRLVC